MRSGKWAFAQTPLGSEEVVLDSAQRRCGRLASHVHASRHRPVKYTLEQLRFFTSPQRFMSVQPGTSKCSSLSSHIIGVHDCSQNLLCPFPSYAFAYVTTLSMLLIQSVHLCPPFQGAAHANSSSQLSRSLGPLLHSSQYLGSIRKSLETCNATPLFYRSKN